MEDEISEFQVELSMEKGRLNNQKELDDEESTQQQNKGWLSNLHRESRVGEKEYQAQIPDLLHQNEQQRNQVFKKHKRLYEPYINELQTYTYRHSLSDYEIKEYLNFAKCISLKDGKSDNEGLLIGLPSSDQVEANALNFLAKCDYSIVTAKFYLVFPTLMYFNAFKSKIQRPVKLSEQEMQEKIDQFVSQLQETKLGQHEKWKQELNEMLESRNQILKIHQHLEAGKLLRYEIPDGIKEVFDKANKFSKELKKVMSDRGSLEKLEQLNQTALKEHKLITNEMIQFEQSLQRCRDWLERLEPHYSDRDKINLKILTGFINEYKSLPLKCDKFEKRFKSVYDQSLDLIEKIPNFSRISKTRGTNNQERIAINDAIKILYQIQSLNVYCDEFDSFECALIINLEKINNLQMHLNDEKQVFTLELLKQLINEASELNFQCAVQDQIQDLYAYFKLIEKVKKQMHDISKLSSLLEEITKGKERGFSSQELDQLESQIQKTIEWFKNFEKLRVEKKNVTEKKFYNNFKIDQNEYKKLQILEDMKVQSQLLKIDEKSLLEFKDVLGEIQNWRDHWIKIKGQTPPSENNTAQNVDSQNVKESSNQQLNQQTIMIIEEDDENQAMEVEEKKIYEKFKADSFEELFKFIQKGLTYGIQTPELIESIEYYKRGVSWTISSMSYINEYCSNSTKSDLLPENLFYQLTDVFNKNKYENELNVKNKQSYEKLDIYLDFPRIPPFCFKSQQYNYLVSLKNDIVQAEKESQAIKDLDLEELQSLDHFSVLEIIPKLDEKQKKLPMNNQDSKKLWQIYVLQKWGKEAMSAHKYIMEEFKENKNLQDLLKKEGIIEFSQIIDSLTQQLQKSDLQEFIDSCKSHWTQIDSKFSRLLDIIQKNPIKEAQTLQESSQNTEQWTYQKIKTLLKNASNFTLKNEFLRLYNEIYSYIEQTDLWIDSFYTKTICKKTIFTKDGKKITKKKGLNLDDLNLSPLLEKKPSNFYDSLPESMISRQNSRNIGVFDLEKSDTINNDGKEDKKEEEESEKNQQELSAESQMLPKNGKMEVEIQEDADEIKNSFSSVKKIHSEVNEDKMDLEVLNKDTPQKSYSVVKEDIIDCDTANKEEESNIQNEDKNENNKASVSKHGTKLTKLLEESESNKLSKEAEKKLLKKSKINTFNYYLSYPMILITFYQGLIKDINNQEMIMAQNKMLELIKYKVKAGELLKTKPTLEEMKSYINRGEVFNCYIPELSIMKKMNKWAHQWINMARKILDSISKNKKNLNNTKVKSKDVLPMDFCEEKYILSFDPNTLCVTIIPRKKNELNNSSQIQPKTIDLKKKNDSGFFDGDLEAQINYLNSEQKDQIQGKEYESKQSISSRTGPGKRAHAAAQLKANGKRNLPNKYIKSSSSSAQQSQIRPKRNSTIPKHYLQGQYHFDTPKLNPDQSSLSPQASHTLQNLKLTPVKTGKGQKEIIIEKTKRKYVRKNQVETVIEQPQLKKKRIIGKDGVKTILIDDSNIASSDKKLKKSQLKQAELLQANGIDDEVQQQIAQISQMHQHSHIQVIHEDENKAYCICRGYSGEESIGCDGCQDWFHFSCIGLKPQLGNVLKKYYCMGCCKRFNRPYLQGHKTEYIWDSMEKISIDQFNEIVKEGLLLPLQIKEIDQILELKQKVDEQLQEMSTLTERGPDLLKIIELYEKAYKLDNDYQGEQIEELRKQEEEKDRQLFQCYLAHFGFPIDFNQAELLLLLIQRRDFARQILRHLYSNKLSLIEQFFNQVQKLFDTNKILTESSQDLCLYNHLKSVYENSIEIKNKLVSLEKTQVEFEQYQQIFSQIEKQQLIIPNLKEHKIKVEEFQKWQHDAQKCINFYNSNNVNKANKMQFEVELRSIIERYESRVLIKSKHIQTLKTIQQALAQESSHQQQQNNNQVYQLNPNSFNGGNIAQKMSIPTLAPPPYSDYQIQLNNQKQMRNQVNSSSLPHYLYENTSDVQFNQNHNDLRNLYMNNLHQSQGIMNLHGNNNNINRNDLSNEDDDDDQIKSFVEDSNEEYGEDFEDEGDNDNSLNNDHLNPLYQQNGMNFSNQTHNQMGVEEDDEDEEEDDQEDEDEEEEEEEEEDDEEEDDEEEQEDDEEEQIVPGQEVQDIQDEAEEEDEEEEEDDDDEELEQGDQQQVGEEEEEEDDEDEEEEDPEEQDQDQDLEQEQEQDEDEEDEEEEDDDENEGQDDQQQNNNYFVPNQNNLVEENQNESDQEELEEEEEDDQEEEIEEEEENEEEEDEFEENENENSEQIQDENIINPMNGVISNANNGGSQMLMNNKMENLKESAFLSPKHKSDNNYNRRNDNNFELSPNNNTDQMFNGEDDLPNSLNVSPNINTPNQIESNANHQ